MSSPPRQSSLLNDIQVETQQRIDEEIASLEARILTLKTTRNTLSPISRLHPEIMQEIFVLSPERPYGSKPSKTPLSISWVCRSWRAIALETSALWCHIASLNPDFIETALSRTRNRQLTFHFFLPDSYTGDSIRLASLCLPNLARMRRLSITSGWGADLDKFARRCPSWVNPAPVLVELRLRCISLPPNTLSGIFPALKHLALEDCEFSWESLPIHAEMESLSIWGPVVKTSVQDIMEKIRIIGSNILTLELGETVTTSTDPLSISDFTALPSRQLLPKITAFTLHRESTQAMSYIFNHISIPSDLNTQIDVQMKGGVNQYDAARALVSCRGMEVWPVTDLDIKSEERSITIWIFEQWEGLDECDEKFENDVTLCFESIEGLSDDTPFFDILPILSAKSLVLSGGYYEEQGSTLLNYLNTRTQLESINILLFYAPTFIRFLYEENQRLDLINGDNDTEDIDDEMKAHIRSMISFPNLTKLGFTGVEDEYCMGYSYFVVVRDWLRWRRLAGFALPELVCWDLGITSREDIRELFKELVETAYDGAREVTSDAIELKFIP